MTFEILRNLDEAQLLKATNPHNYTAKDMSDLAFLYMLALHVMRSEYGSAPFAQGYGQRTNRNSGFRSDDIGNTDLYQFLNVLTDHDGDLAKRLSNPKANDLFYHALHFTPSTARNLLSAMARSTYNATTARRLLLQLEQQLNITDSNYKSIRRIVGDWSDGNLSTHQKKLAVTRLLQALRARARGGDVLQRFEKFAKELDLEYHGVANPETGQAATAATAPSTGFGWLKTLATVAGVAAADRLLRKGL